MKVSQLWLEAFIHLPLSMAELGDQLTHAGIEVDALESIDKDIVITLKIPPNRGDCLSMEGMVREIALLNNLTVIPAPLKNNKATISDVLSVKNEAFSRCPLYMGRIIKNIKNSVPTPSWMLDRLEKSGIRSVSLIVDIMNYVMLELGQPLHAFDLTKIEGGIVVRLAEENESITLLDNQTFSLKKDTLVIADQKEPLAIAGIMGGLNSSVTTKTNSIFIESAYFNPIPIRVSGSQYGLRTDASYRFERGVDFQLPKKALERATELVLEIAGGECGPIVECESETLMPKATVIHLNSNKIQEILGTDLKVEQSLDILNRAGMSITVKDTDWKVVPPSFRHDLALEVDLIEEIARVWGFHHLKSLMPVSPMVFNAMPENRVSVNEFKKALVNRGYFEAITYSFINSKLSELFFEESKEDTALLLKNPISTEMALMRESLWPGLIKTLEYNQRRQQLRGKIFEVGNCFKKINGKIIEEIKISGMSMGPHCREQWGIVNRPQDYFDSKEEVEALISLTHQNESFRFIAGEHPALHPGQTAKILKGDELIGFLGMIHPRITKALDLIGPLFAFELDLKKLSDKKMPEFRDLSKYPAIRRDLAIIIGQNVFASDLKSAIVKCAGDLLQDVFVFDVYQGKGIETGKKSVALGLILQHPSRTLVEEEVNEAMNRIVSGLSNQFQAILRE